MAINKNNNIFYSRNRKVDIFEYVEDKMTKDPTLEFYVAVDSKRRGRKTTYVLTVVLYSPVLRRGAEVWFQKSVEKTPPDLFTRLWKEAEIIMDWSPVFYKKLRHVIGTSDKMNVHIDFNPNPKWRSYKVYKAALPWVKSTGFNVVAKPDSWACRAADHLA